SVHLAYALRSYLSDERAFECECPPLCPRCSASVTNFMARYCGRCGLQLSGGLGSDWPPAIEHFESIAVPTRVRIERDDEFVPSRLPIVPPIAEPIRIPDASP